VIRNAHWPFSTNLWRRASAPAAARSNASYIGRGDILPKCDPTNPAPAEDAFKTAIALAKRQGARGYQLLASLALAQLYRTTSRLFEAHALLAPEFEGFSPTPDMPEIAEAQALLRALNGSSIAAGLLGGV
jgi:hypothetical protein